MELKGEQVDQDALCDSVNVKDVAVLNGLSEQKVRTQQLKFFVQRNQACYYTTCSIDIIYFIVNL